MAEVAMSALLGRSIRENYRTCRNVFRRFIETIKTQLNNVSQLLRARPRLLESVKISRTHRHTNPCHPCYPWLNLVSFFWIEVACRTFSHARHRRRKLFGSSRVFREGPRNRRRRKWTSLMSFFQSNVLRDAGAHHRERRYQHPEPPRLANRSRQRDCDDEKTDSHEDVLEGTLQRYFFAMLAAATTFHEILWRRLRQLARQRLWYEANV